jgi:hypothetical protein
MAGISLAEAGALDEELRGEMSTLRLIDASVGAGPQGVLMPGVNAGGASGAPLPPGSALEEFILEGQATRYRLQGGEYRPDGRWQAESAGTARYRTRVLALRPAVGAFNGTVVTVWNNVSSGFDGVFAGYELPKMVEDGFAVIGVSAQKVGIDGALGLRATDSDRYGLLDHPGDDFSFDIFSQVAALATASDATLLGGLNVQRVVAAGASQSACRLASLHNALHPTEAIDAYMLIVYAGNGTHLDTSVDVSGFAEVPDVSSVNILPFRSHRLRDDLGVPVFIVNSETEACLFSVNDQPDSESLRIWESAGTSHVGLSSDPAAAFPAGGIPGLPAGAPCRGSFRPAISAAYQHLQRWIEEGTPPPSQPRIETAPDGTGRRDEHGNVLGGIRWPHVEVPLGLHRGETPPGMIDLLGTTTPFTHEKVRSLYASRADYETRSAVAIEALVATGVVLGAESSTIRDPLVGTAWI